MAFELFLPIDTWQVARKLIFDEDMTAIDCNLAGQYFDDLKWSREHDVPDVESFASRWIKANYDMIGNRGKPVEILYFLN